MAENNERNNFQAGADGTQDMKESWEQSNTGTLIMNSTVSCSMSFFSEDST